MGRARIHGGGRPLIDLTGQRFGKLSVLQRVPRPADVRDETSGAYFQCACECGRTVALPSLKLRTGRYLDCRGPAHRPPQR